MEKDRLKNKVEEPDLAGTYTAADYMQWKLDELVELIHGKIVKMSPSPSTIHQMISLELSRQLGNQFHKSTCSVFHAPLDVYLLKDGEDIKEGENVLEPDLFVVCDPNKIKKFGCVGAPDLVIEILSPSTSKKDEKWKFDLYEEYGVREYWIVSSTTRSVFVNVLENGQYRTNRPLTEDDKLTSEIFPDLEVDLEEVFRDVYYE